MEMEFDNNLGEEDILLRAENIKMIVMDVDGTLTDGKIFVGNEGELMKAFDVKDGQGIVLWHKSGKQSAIITGRSSQITDLRAKALGIQHVYQGRSDKRVAYEELKEKTGLDDDDICYIGDDLPDIPLMLRVGLAVAVADATEETRMAAHYVTESPGGMGAVREAVELILSAQGLWEERLAEFYK